MNEEIPSGNFEESVPSDAGWADDIPKVSLSLSTTDESPFNLENTKISFTRHGIRIIDRGDNTKTTLLHAAAGFGDIESVRYLLEQDVDVNITDERGLTPLHNGVHHNHYAIAKLLVKHGASVNREDVCGFTPLHFAAGITDWSIYRLLLKNGGDIHKKNKNGETPHDLFQKQLYSLGEVQRKQAKATGSHKESARVENSFNGMNDSQVHLQTESLGSTSKGLRHVQETAESLRTTVRPGVAIGKIKTEKGRRSEKVRNNLNRQKSNKSKVNKKAKLTRRKKALHKKILEKRFKSYQDPSQYSAKTKRERMSLKKLVPAIHLIKCINSNQWRIIDPHVNDGSHKPPEISIMPSVESGRIVSISSQNVVSQDNSNGSSLGTHKEPGTAVATAAEPVFKQSTMEKCSSKSTCLTTEQKCCIPFGEQTCLKTDISERQQNIDVLKTECRKVPDVKNCKVLAKTFHTAHSKLPEQHSSKKAETVSTLSLADVESNKLEHTSRITSLLPNFVALGLEEERENNTGLEEEKDNHFETVVKIREYLTKKGSIFRKTADS